MRLHVAIVLALVLALSGVVAAQTPSGNSPSNDNYPAQLQSAADLTQSQIADLEQQLTNADNTRSEELQRQISELKKQGEIRRLEILLTWAQSRGDEARVAEVQRALDNWTRPAQVSGTAVILTPEDKAALSGQPLPSNPNPESK